MFRSVFCLALRDQDQSYVSSKRPAKATTEREQRGERRRRHTWILLSPSTVDTVDTDTTDRQKRIPNGTPCPTLGTCFGATRPYARRAFYRPSAVISRARGRTRDTQTKPGHDRASHRAQRRSGAESEGANTKADEQTRYALVREGNGSGGDDTSLSASLRKDKS